MTRHMTLGTWALAAMIGVASGPMLAQHGPGTSGGGESQVRANGITIAHSCDGPSSSQMILLTAELLTQLVKRVYRVVVYGEWGMTFRLRLPAIADALVSVAMRTSQTTRAPSPR